MHQGMSFICPYSDISRYIYTDKISLDSFELACEVCYAAKKYLLPALVEECTKFLWRDLYPRNACRALEFAKLFEEPQRHRHSEQRNQRHCNGERVAEQRIRDQQVARHR